VADEPNRSGQSRGAGEGILLFLPPEDRTLWADVAGPCRLGGERFSAAAAAGIRVPAGPALSIDHWSLTA